MGSPFGQSLILHLAGRAEDSLASCFTACPGSRNARIVYEAVRDEPDGLGFTEFKTDCHEDVNQGV